MIGWVGVGVVRASMIDLGDPGRYPNIRSDDQRMRFKAGDLSCEFAGVLEYGVLDFQQETLEASDAMWEHNLEFEHFGGGERVDYAEIPRFLRLVVGSLFPRTMCEDSQERTAWRMEREDV
jgi:hypothetical protein